MDECKIPTENKLLEELQNVSEKISDLISDGKFQSIIPIEKKRLEIRIKKLRLIKRQQVEN